MPQYPFPYDLQVHVIADDRFEVAYYAYNKKKYKRIREIATQTWQDTEAQEVDSGLFFFVVACIERRKRGTRGLVGMG